MESALRSCLRSSIPGLSRFVTRYGCYTIHTLKDGVVEGMLSVHVITGQVWYHTWHGAFVQMVEGEQGH